MSAFLPFGVQVVFGLWAFGLFGIGVFVACLLQAMSRFFVCSLLYVCISLSLVARMLLIVVSFFIAIYVYVGFLDFCMSLARVGLAGITFAPEEIMVAIDTLGSTACRQNYTAFLDDMYLLRPSVNFC